MCIGVFNKWIAYILVWLLKRNKSRTVTFRLRGRGNRRGVRRYKQDLPLRYASRITVYVELPRKRERKPDWYALYCDNCGKGIKITDGRNYIKELQQDITSANKGESATICDKCSDVLYPKKTSEVQYE